MKDKHTMGSSETSVESLSQASLYESIRTLLLASRTQVRQTVNTAMVQTYWHIGRMIVEDEQGGQKRAAYGKQVLPELSKRLTQEFGSGFSAPSLWNYRQFYLCFPILSAVRRELTWTHYKSLLRIENLTAREWYAQEAAQQGWSVRALDRQISTLYYERLLSTQDKAKAQLFASKYQALMPTEAELQAELERDRALLEIHKAQA